MNGGPKIIFLIFNNMNIELHKQLNITDYFDWEYYNNKYCGKHLQYTDFMCIKYAFNILYWVFMFVLAYRQHG